MFSNIRYYRDKAYFKTIIDNNVIMARTACIVMNYVDEFGIKKVLTICEKIDKNIIEFPGGKVEEDDLDIYDTAFREIWEEIILKGALGPNNNKHLRNWKQIRLNIMNSNHYDQVLCTQLYNRLRKSKAVSYGGNAFRTIYFIVDITLQQAQHLICYHGMIPLSVDILNHIVAYNNMYRNTSKYYKNKDTHIHILNDVPEIYKLRGRDFEGMFRFIGYV